MITSDLPRPQDIAVALIGYGSAGRIFHAPLISGVPGLQLASIVSSQSQAVGHDWPDVQCVTTMERVLQDARIQLVVIATPNATHFELACAALQAGKHVVIDKPCTVTLAETDALLALAQRQCRTLTVFQNRRWDSDFLTVQQVIQSAALGRVVEVSSHFDRYRPTVPVRWREQNLPGSGLWFDLGPHLLDQTVAMFGAPDEILLDCAALRDAAVVNDWFHAVLRYHRGQGLRVVLHASTLVAEPGPRWVVHGTQGTFTLYGLDAQEDDLKRGGRPYVDHLDEWGTAGESGQLVCFQHLPGVASLVEVRQKINCTAGNYLSFYTQLRDHLAGRIALAAVTSEQIRAVMQLLTYGEQSAKEARWVALHAPSQDDGARDQTPVPAKM